MLLPLLAASLSFQGAAKTVELSRGAKLGGEAQVPAFTYWDCEDTTLDSGDPDASRGGEATLIGGSASTILIRFGDLTRVLGRERHITQATLHLKIATGSQPALQAAARVLQPWGEGPLMTTNQTIALVGSSGNKQGGVTAPKMAATWHAREAGFDNGNWQQAGAKGPLDAVAIPGVSLQVSDKDVQIRGLANAFQWMADHPAHNFGIALSFSTPIEFNSSKAATDRPRLELECADAPPAHGPDLRVVSIARRTGGGFVAHIKNLGDAPANGFDAAWTLNGRVGSVVRQQATIPAGGEVSLSTTSQPKSDPTDVRSGTVTLDLNPGDPAGGMRGLSVFSHARTLDFVVDPAVAEQAKSGVDFDGGRNIESWIQAEVAVFNDTYLGQSRFSFALEGSKERVAVQSVSVDAKEPEAEPGEAKIVITPELYHGGAFSVALQRAIAEAIGLQAYDPMILHARSGSIAIAGASDRGCDDTSPGLMGGGDTRYDGKVAGVMMVSDQEYAPEAAQPQSDPTDLLALTDVYMLDSRVGKPIQRGLPSVAPKAILLMARSFQFRPLAGAKLSFYQTSGGKIADGPPAFTLTVPESGDILIPNRDSESIFGKLNPDGSNGVLLVKAELNGMTEWAFIKAWQVVDAYARGIDAAGILMLTFDLPESPLEADQDLASQKFVTDSTGQSADKLGPLVGGDGKTMVSLGAKQGDWVEIDLGRDRTLGEIRLSAPGDKFWNQFDILLYGTGQRVSEAAVFAQERDWSFDRRNRSDGPAENATVSFRGAPIQVRFVRIVNRSGGPGEISKISVIPARVSN